MRRFFERHPDLNVPVYFVWLPMFPRPQEWWALPGMVEEFSGWGVPQYWDDERKLSGEIRSRLVPTIDDQVPWDLFILFDRDATWADAQDHVLGWGSTVIGHREELDALLSAL